MKLLLIGAGGHARTVMDAVMDNGHRIVAYAAPAPSAWLDADRIQDSKAVATDYDGIVMGIGGVAPPALTSRLALFRDYLAKGFEAPAIQHSSALVSPEAAVAEGALILTRAIVNPGAQIGPGVIVNTGAIVEHDTKIGAGAHVAPGAIVLGGVSVGEGAMIGAGAVVLPGAVVPAGGRVAALERFGA